MNTKERKIIDEIIQEILGDLELSELKERLNGEDNYIIFCEKLIEVIIEKNKTLDLTQFLRSNSLSEKTLLFKNKTQELIELLAELHLSGESSENANHHH